MRGRDIERLPAVTRLEHGVSAARETPAQQRAHLSLIFGDENRFVSGRVIIRRRRSAVALRVHCGRREITAERGAFAGPAVDRDASF